MESCTCFRWRKIFYFEWKIHNFLLFLILQNNEHFFFVLQDFSYSRHIKWNTFLFANQYSSSSSSSTVVVFIVSEGNIQKKWGASHLFTDVPVHRQQSSRPRKTKTTCVTRFQTGYNFRRVKLTFKHITIRHSYMNVLLKYLKTNKTTKNILNGSKDFL